MSDMAITFVILGLTIVMFVWGRYSLDVVAFGSLLAQDGVSIDKISAWMGNTPEVCRRHYAQFVPRDRRDEDIDRL